MMLVTRSTIPLCLVGIVAMSRFRFDVWVLFQGLGYKGVSSGREVLILWYGS